MIVYHRFSTNNDRSVFKQRDNQICPRLHTSCDRNRTAGRQALFLSVFRNNSSALQLVYPIDGGRTSRKSTLLPPVGSLRGCGAVCRFSSVN